jgi:peptide/nickel transport system ATP-binding protein
MTEPLLRVDGLTKHFPIAAGLWKRSMGWINAVDGVSFHIDSGETFGIVGESGCGKTTVGRLILRLIEPTAGEVSFRLNGTEVDLVALHGERLRQFRKHMQLVFQDPFSSLNPRMTVLDTIAEPLRAAHFGSRKDIEDRVRWLTEAVGLKVEYLRRYPHAFSGGQRQRICIARALALNPKLVICDEPVSALDVSVQAQILNLLRDLQDEFGITYLFIAHDLSVVENLSARVAVMYAGGIVEMGGTNEVFAEPLHPYTEALMDALPLPDPERKSDRIVLPGEVADPSNLPSGCPFHPRCQYAEARCREEKPALRELEPGHTTACLRAEDLKLRGAARTG